MSHITLELSNKEDLDLLLSFAKRLKINIVSVDSVEEETKLEYRRKLLKKASEDPLFLADIAEITNDFSGIESEFL